MVALLEDRTLLSRATLTTLAVSAGALTYGHAELLTATVTTDPVSSTKPTGGTISFKDGNSTLATENLAGGTATFSTTGLSAGVNVLTAVYSGDANYGGSSTPLTTTSIIMSIAGGGIGDGGLATAAALDSPLGVAVDAGGDIFIADSNNNVIREVSAATGVITTVAGVGIAGYTGDGGQATDAELDYPTAIARDSSGDIFIADSLNNLIREVSGGVISTVAGNGNDGYSGDGHEATAAELSSPSGVAVDSHGNLYIADFGNDVIREVSGGVINTVAGNGISGYTGDGHQATAAELSSPSGIAVDTSENLYIADSGNNVIREVSAGVINTVAGDGTSGYSGDGQQATAAELAGPSAVAVSAGTIYIADTYNDVIREVSAGVINTVAGDGTSGYSGDGSQATGAELSNPSGVAVDSSGNIYIADTENNVIREVSLGMIKTVAGDGFVTYSGDGGQASNAGLSNPASVTVDSAGNIYIADFYNSVVREVNASSGVITTVAGDGTSGYSGDGQQATAAQLNEPTGVAVDAAGDIFIADSGNNVIREVNTQGLINTIAGDGTAGYSGDGNPATAALLDEPEAVAVNASGNLYIADTGNNVIREVAGGVINTIAGNGNYGDSGDGGSATAAELAGPTGVAVDASGGDLYIADTGNNLVREVSLSIINTVAGGGSPSSGIGDGGPATDAVLSDPGGVAVDSSGNLYIADTGDNVIREVNTHGVINTDAGNGTSGYGGDGGSATDAELNGPVGIAVDASANLYIADSGNNLVREVPISMAGAQSVTVTPAALTITADRTSKTYGDSVTFAGTEFTESGLVTANGDMITSVALTSAGATAAGQVAGSPYTIVPTAAVGSGLSNYTITYDDGTLTVNKHALLYTIGNDSQTYGNPANLAADLAATINTGVNGENLAITCSSTGDTATADVNTYAITGALSNGTGLLSDYAVTLTPGTLTVNKHALSYTIANDSQTYSSPANLAADLGATINAGVNGEKLAITYSSTGDTATADVSTYAITGALSNGTGLLSDYAVTLTPGTLTVTKAPLTVTADSATKVYGASLPALSDQITGFVNGDTLKVVSGMASLTTTATASSGAGVYPIQAAVGTLSAADYDFPAANFHGNDLTVTPAPLTITAVSQTMVAGQAVPHLTANFSGFVNGDTAASLATPPEISTSATSASPPGDYSIIVTGAGSPNYTISFVPATLTVIPAPATVQSISIQKVSTGKHKSPKAIVLKFSEALNAADAQNINTYNLVTVPKKKKQRGQRVAIPRATYTAGALTVTLFTRKPLAFNPPLQLTIIAANLLDALSRPLDGNNSGQPGANYVATLSKSGITIDS